MVDDVRRCLIVVSVRLHRWSPPLLQGWTPFRGIKIGRARLANLLSSKRVYRPVLMKWDPAGSGATHAITLPWWGRELAWHLYAGLAATGETASPWIARFGLLGSPP